MVESSFMRRQELQRLDRPALEEYQLQRLNRLLDAILPHNPFYREKLRSVRRPISSLDQLSQLPLTTKQELVEYADSDGTGGHRTHALTDYTRMHRTSGTQGHPLTILDTTSDWQWWIDTWQYVLDAAEVTPQDRALMAFSFGPFIGFWTAYDALVQRGALVIPAGGLSTLGRLELLQQTGATCVCCTPTYALRMAEVAAAHGIALDQSTVRCLIVAGEPGGSIPQVRRRIESAWRADVVDHSGATEIGPWGFSTADRLGLHVVESEFIAEFLPHPFAPLATPAVSAAEHAQPMELVLTSLGRHGMPVIRYRTGDLVLPRWESCASDGTFVRLEGGILGRTDDMVVIRGVNVFPSSIEAIVREFPEIEEFRVTALKAGAMDDMLVEIEDPDDNPTRVALRLQQRLGLRIEVRCVTCGSLPRYQAKSQRFVDQR